MGLAKRGISFERLKISKRAHVVMPYHKALDGIKEEARGANDIGTTKKESVHAIWIKWSVQVFVFVTCTTTKYSQRKYEKMLRLK